MPPVGHLLEPGFDAAHLVEQAAEAFQAGRLALAEELCGHVLGRAPGHAAARRQLGLLRLVGGDPAGCQALLEPLLALFPDDPDIAIALAEAAWATGGVTEAIPHYRRALGIAPGRVRVRARFGLALLTAGHPGLARQELAAVVDAEPDARSLTHLGMALIAEGQAQAALPVLLRAAHLDLADPGSVFQLGQALRDLGRIDDALPALAEAVRRGPDQPHLRLALGDALFARGEYGRGKAELRQSTALDPAQPVAWAKLGDMEQFTGDPLTALRCYRCAAALDENNAELAALLGNALLAVGDAAGQGELARSMTLSWASASWATASWTSASWTSASWTASKPRTSGLRVGILAAPGGANTPTGFIVDHTRFAVSPIFMLDGFDYPVSRLASGYDVLFNAVSDPDAAPQALVLATRLAAEIGRPVANAPAAIPGTVRERMAERLTGIPGLHVPRTARCSRAELAARGAPLAVRDGPVLVRPAGSHGGRNLVVARTAEEVQQAAAALPDADVFVTEFVDFRSEGGLYRKLRIVFAGGQPFPVHLAIGEHWLSHYYRTGMAERPDWRAEEAAFLSAPKSYLGPDICRALEEVQTRVGLDYFGIDGAIGRDGKLIVFECNAAMLVRHADRPAMFDYKREPAERIRDAVGTMLERLAA